MVRELVFPYMASTVQKVMWLAYCSHQFFLSATSNTIPSLDNTFAEGRYWRYTFKSLPGAVALPAQFQAFAPPHTWKQGETERRYPPPFNQEFLALDYTVEHQTNFHQLVLPLAFEANYYLVVQPGPHASPVRFKSTIIRGLLENVVELSEDDPRPELMSEATIRDTRFDSLAGGPLLYEEKEQSWLDRSSPTLQEQVASKKRIKPRPGAAKGDATSLGWLVLLLVLLLLPIFLARRKKNVSSTKYTQ
jgi:hypothetical protein